MSHTPPTGPYDSTVEQLYNVAHDIEMQVRYPRAPNRTRVALLLCSRAAAFGI